MYRNIMVPLDGSELAECVFPHVEAITEGCEVKNVTLVRVDEPMKPPASVRVRFSESILKNLEIEKRAAAETYIKETAERLRLKGAEVGWKLLEGSPAEALVEYAAHNGIDMIILATHGRSGIGKWMMGSVADRILRSSCVPVLMVRAPGCVAGF